MHVVHPLPVPPHFQGREEALQALDASVKRLGITAVIGPGGIGKTALLARWLERHMDDDGYVWRFDAQQAGEALMEGLAAWLQRRAPRPPAPLELVVPDPPGFSPVACGLGRVDEVLQPLVSYPFRPLVVLDGLERLQRDDGSLSDGTIEDFLERVPAHARVLLTAVRPLRLTVPVREIPLGVLSTEEATRYLEERGVVERDAMVSGTAGHPLTLALAAAAGAVERFDLPSILAALRDRLPRDAVRMLGVLCVSNTPVTSASLQDIVWRLREEAPSPDAVEQLQTRGLVERIFSQGQPGTPMTTWASAMTVHSVVRQAWLSPVEATEYHRWVVQYLQGPASLDTQIDSPMISVLARMEALVRHLIGSGQLDEAFGYYDTIRRDLSRWTTWEAAERIMRMLLAVRPGHPSLNNELGLTLDKLGRHDEAARHYLRALRHRLRAYRHSDVPETTNDMDLDLAFAFEFNSFRSACRILENLMANAVVRGRLPLAEHCARLARTWTVQYGDPDREVQSQVYLWYVRTLRGRAAVSPEPFLDSIRSGPRVRLVSDIWIRQGRTTDAWKLADRCRSGLPGEELTLWCEVRMKQAALALTFDTVTALTRGWRELRPTREAWCPAPDTSKADLVVHLPAIRRTGNRVLLAEALVTMAGFCRRSGAKEDAEKYLFEALALSRRHGLRLVAIHAALEAGTLVQDVEVLQQALAASRKIDYAWGVDGALAAMEMPLERTEVWEYRPPAVKPPASDTGWPQSLVAPGWDVTPPLQVHTLLRWDPTLPPLRVPTPTELAAPSPAELFSSILKLCAEAGAAPSDVLPRYLLNVMLCLAPAPSAASQMATLLAPFLDPVIGGILLLAATVTDTAASRLRRTLEEHSKIRTDFRAAAWFNLGVFYEAHDRSSDAVEAYRHSQEARPQLDTLVRLHHLNQNARCTVDVERLAKSIETGCRLRQVPYPYGLDELVPGWWATHPVCDLDGTPLLYRVDRRRARFLLGCRRHHRCHDSTLGWLRKIRHADAFPMGWQLGMAVPTLTVSPSPDGRPPVVHLITDDTMASWHRRAGDRA